MMYILIYSMYKIYITTFQLHEHKRTRTRYAYTGSANIRQSITTCIWLRRFANSYTNNWMLHHFIFPSIYQALSFGYIYTHCTKHFRLSPSSELNRRLASGTVLVWSDRVYSSIIMTSGGSKGGGGAQIGSTMFLLIQTFIRMFKYKA